MNLFDRISWSDCWVQSTSVHYTAYSTHSYYNATPSDSLQHYAVYASWADIVRCRCVGHRMFFHISHRHPDIRHLRCRRRRCWTNAFYRILHSPFLFSYQTIWSSVELLAKCKYKLIAEIAVSAANCMYGFKWQLTALRHIRISVSVCQYRLTALSTHVFANTLADCDCDAFSLNRYNLSRQRARTHIQWTWTKRER